MMVRMTQFRIPKFKIFFYLIIVATILLTISKIHDSLLKSTLSLSSSFDSELLLFDDYDDNFKISNTTVFCMILTSPNNFNTKTKVVHQTWAKHCDKHVFVTVLNNNLSKNITHEYNEPFPILQPAYHESEVYTKLTDKVFKTIMSVYKHYDNYDWYLKADDDTFVFIENLKLFLNDYDRSMPITFGYELIDSNKTFLSGGAGYVLSNKSLKRLADKLISNYSFCFQTGREDVDLAACSKKVGIRSLKTLDSLGRERFHPISVPSHITENIEFPEWLPRLAVNPPKSGVECCSEASISFHYMSPEQIKKLYILWRKYKKNKGSLKLTDILKLV